MANSVDNALARFLYAILKQKNLKDVSTIPPPFMCMCITNVVINIHAT
jgi:hypothetical protein